MRNFEHFTELKNNECENTFAGLSLLPIYNRLFLTGLFNLNDDNLMVQEPEFTDGIVYPPGCFTI